MPLSMPDYYELSRQNLSHVSAIANHEQSILHTRYWMSLDIHSKTIQANLLSNTFEKLLKFRQWPVVE